MLTWSLTFKYPSSYHTSSSCQPATYMPAPSIIAGFQFHITQNCYGRLFVLFSYLYCYHTPLFASINSINTIQQSSHGLGSRLQQSSIGHSYGYQ
ncbi:hypothetical protein FOXYSP1_16703 [Fusarium oxysporum f. sp. phaseoli]